MTALSGLVPVLATPFDPSGDLDLASMARLAAWQVRAGADAVAVFGLASEGFTLTAGERAEVLSCVRGALPDHVPVVAGVSATGTREALEQAEAAAAGGANALMVLPPHLVVSSPEQLVDFYTAVAGAGLPIMIQDAPVTSRVSMSAAVISRLARIPGVDSVKIETQPTMPKVAEIAASARPGFVVFGGQNALFCLEEYDRGAVGTMPACEFTDLLAPVLRAFVDGDRARARSGFARLLPLIRFGLQPGLAWAVHKEALVRRGLIDHATVRAPARPLDEPARRWLYELLDDLGLGLPGERDEVPPGTGPRDLDPSADRDRPEVRR